MKKQNVKMLSLGDLQRYFIICTNKHKEIEEKLLKSISMSFTIIRKEREELKKWGGKF